MSTSIHDITPNLPMKAEYGPLIQGGLERLKLDLGDHVVIIHASGYDAIRLGNSIVEAAVNHFQNGHCGVQAFCQGTDGTKEDKDTTQEPVVDPDAAGTIHFWDKTGPPIRAVCGRTSVACCPTNESAVTCPACLKIMGADKKGATPAEDQGPVLPERKVRLDGAHVFEFGDGSEVCFENNGRITAWMPQSSQQVDGKFPTLKHAAQALWAAGFARSAPVSVGPKEA